MLVNGRVHTEHRPSTQRLQLGCIVPLLLRWRLRYAHSDGQVLLAHCALPATQNSQHIGQFARSKTGM
jgi:hypothetical protein